MPQALEPPPVRCAQIAFSKRLIGRPLLRSDRQTVSAKLPIWDAWIYYAFIVMPIAICILRKLAGAEQGHTHVVCDT
jgi:hypothetical protein